jgi:hypothetical protein
VSANTLQIDWIEKGISPSPALWTVPSASTTAMPNRSGLTAASGGI